MSFFSSISGGGVFLFNQEISATQLQSGAPISLDIPEGYYLFGAGYMLFKGGTTPYDFGGNAFAIVGNTSGYRFLGSSNYAGTQTVNFLDIMVPKTSPNPINTPQETFSFGNFGGYISGNQNLTLSLLLAKIS